MRSIYLKIFPLSQPKERTQKVFNAIKATVENNTEQAFRAGDVSQALRDGGFPLGSWEVRGEFSALESAGLIALEASSATWRLTATGADTTKIK